MICLNKDAGWRVIFLVLSVCWVILSVYHFWNGNLLEGAVFVVLLFALFVMHLLHKKR